MYFSTKTSSAEVILLITTTLYFLTYCFYWFFSLAWKLPYLCR